jgi:hypothetical protein
MPHSNNDEVNKLKHLVTSGKLSSEEERKSVERLDTLGFEVSIREEEGHYEGGTRYCIGSDSSSNCHAMCVNGDMCQVVGGTWVVDLPRIVEIHRK